MKIDHRSFHFCLFRECFRFSRWILDAQNTSPLIFPYLRTSKIKVSNLNQGRVIAHSPKIAMTPGYNRVETSPRDLFWGLGLITLRLHYPHFGQINGMISLGARRRRLAPQNNFTLPNWSCGAGGTRTLRRTPWQFPLKMLYPQNPPDRDSRNSGLDSSVSHDTNS